MTSKMARPSITPRSRQAKLALRHAGDLSGWLAKAKQDAASGRPASLTVEEISKVWSRRFAGREVEELIIPRRTLARRKAQRGKLTLEESNKALRLARIASEADRVFGNQEKADRWLRAPHSRLNGKTPLSLLKSEAGAIVIEEMLGQIDHGIFA